MNVKTQMNYRTREGILARLDSMLSEAALILILTINLMVVSKVFLYTLQMPIIRVSPKAMHELSLSGFLQYGHLDILIEYAGIRFDEVNPFLLTTHGIGTPEQLAQLCKRSENSGLMFLPWHACPRKSRKCIPIGSPWLYLLENLEHKYTNNIQMEKEKSMNLFVVPHSSTSQRIVRDWESIHNLLKLWIESSGTTNNSLLLHWADYLNVQFVNKLREFELPILCNGYGGHASSLSSNNVAGDRQNFLTNTYSLLNLIKTLHVLEPTTLTYYAATLGVEIRMASKSFYDDAHSFLFPSSMWSPEKSQENRTNMEFFWQQQARLSSMDSNDKISLSKDFLGLHYVKSRDNLKEILTSKPKYLSKMLKIVSAYK